MVVVEAILDNVMTEKFQEILLQCSVPGNADILGSNARTAVKGSRRLCLDTGIILD
jgi:hypothetical protein